MPGLLSDDIGASGFLLDSLLSMNPPQHEAFVDSSPRAYLYPPGDADILLPSPRSAGLALNLDLKELAAIAALGGSGGGDSPMASAAMGSLHRFLPSNNEDSSAAQHVYSSDEFRMFEFKVRRCMRGRSHDWTECPFAHPGEKARRRDPRRFHYSGTACPDFRKGLCRSGEACELAHGVFECWLHPARYRTQPCKDGRGCKRRVCFFAHTPEQLRLAPPPPSSSPPPPNQPGGFEQQMLVHKQELEQMLHERSLCESALFSSKHQQQMSSSPTSTLVHHHSPPPLSPPLSPCGGAGGSPESPPMSPCSSPPLLDHYSAAAATAAAMLRSSRQQAELQAAAAALLTPPAARRQLERIKSMPSAAAVAAEQRRRLAAAAYSSASFNGRSSGVNSLVAALRNMELAGYGAAAPPASPPMSPSWVPPSPLRRASELGRHQQQQQQQQQFFGENQQMWGTGGGGALDQHSHFEDHGMRVESGRSKMYSKIGRENLPDCGDCPDLGWVTDLVADH